MNLLLDIGNTAIKWALCDAATVVEKGRCTPAELKAGLPDSLAAAADSASGAMACASGEVPALLSQVPLLSPSTALPLAMKYRTPDTLGPDRVAAACGAQLLHPGCDCLVVDAGTCITVDFVSADGSYYGGAIMPGLNMTLRALHEHTARLPLVDLAACDHAPLLGRTTEESIVAGTLGATMLSLAGFVAAYRQRSPSLHVMLTGGDAHQLTQAGADHWELEPDLTLIGLNAILLHNQ